MVEASTLAIEAQRDAGFVKMGVKASGLGEGPNIELIGMMFFMVSSSWFDQPMAHLAA
jgi:hypothetical protein